MSAPRTLTVVIPTLGYDCLNATVDRLNRGSVVPNEILVCIPEDEAPRVSDISAENVTIVPTNCRGQVSQRAVGFEAASSEYVMQLDDDMLVDEHCLERLLVAIAAAGKETAVAASLINQSNGQSFYRAPTQRGLLKLYYLLLNGRRGYVPGCITKAGTNVGVDPAVSPADVIDVEWIPGGCVVHRKDNLVLEHFYPFKGKAYCEDLFHSFYLRSKGVSLSVCPGARCIVDDVPYLNGASVQDFSAYVRADLRARAELVRMSQLSMPRMYLYYTCLTARYMFAQITQRLGRAA